MHTPVQRHVVERGKEETGRATPVNQSITTNPYTFQDLPRLFSPFLSCCCKG